MPCTGCKRRRTLIIATARNVIGSLTLMRRDQRSPEAQAYQHLRKSYRWQQARKRYLKRNPLCVRCQARAKAEGRLTATVATVVHHLVAHKGDATLFWDESNWQSLCAPCHDSDAQSEERGGYSKGVDSSGCPTDPRHRWNQ